MCSSDLASPRVVVQKNVGSHTDKQQHEERYQVVLVSFEEWILNSAGLECYPYKVEVIGSIPIESTK